MFPRLYAIVDRGCSGDANAFFRQTRALLDSGVTLLQYRDKTSEPREMLANAREIQRLSAGRARLIVNDRADLCLAAACDGVHLGQDDLSPEAVRGIVGAHLWVGVSTHSPEQL
ncbi:MAG: thiamine phosphate synthase, partial [Acidobacteriaceae bacterium]|nr:thiamine phosphate synthase [Acidobacteriaceae bacterium]